MHIVLIFIGALLLAFAADKKEFGVFFIGLIILAVGCYQLYRRMGGRRMFVSARRRRLLASS